ncbi:MAG: tetratricopeptide repeat protein [Saprospiraceae bacterium]|nr:tetratricopeptide repeat protein [Saprospiraceae bacterium]
MKKELNRRLAAIMFTDMVGFTALMQRNEKLGLQKRNRHKEVIEHQHEKYNGEIIQYFGDGTLSIFSNSIDAVGCAIEMQKALKTPIDVPMRIGIHAGNIVLESDGIIGDAVNIASRIESFANIGGVLISDAVQDQIKNQVHLDFVPLGKFNLKNVERPFEIYAVSAEGLIVPDPKFLHGKGEKMANLKSIIPEPATPILGREKEVESLLRLLESNQVVTVTGTGGMGKTRISLEICKRLKSELQDGIAFVSMATLTDATEVIPTLAAALDIKEAPGRGLVKGVAALISDHRALLVLDNLEQVISAAQEIAELVSMCPNLKILCTSRTPLKIKAEQEYALHPLPLPVEVEMSSLLNYPGIELFVSRAQKVNMDFELIEDNAEAVVEICRRMDGLPLALELAAARIRILPPNELLKRLSRALDVLTTGSKDLPERHQTLRATIDWSYSLVKEPEQQLFRRLAAFSGSFTLEAVEGVCYKSEDDAFLAMDEIESLLDKGLVEKLDGGRFNLLQTISDFAVEKLKAADEMDTVFQKHAEFYFKVAQLVNLGTQGEQQIRRMKQGALEEANIHAALDYCLKKANTGNDTARELGLSICGQLETYWHIRGKHITAENYVNAFFKTSENQTPTIGKCMAMQTLTLAVWTLGKFAEANEKALATHKMAKELDDPNLLVRATLMLGFTYIGIDMELAKKHLSEGEAIGRKLNDNYQLSFTLAIQGIFNTIIGDLTIAKEKYEESLGLLLKIEDYEVSGLSLSGLAMLEKIAFNFDKAIDLYHQALVSYQVVGDRPEEARVLNEMSWVYLTMKDLKAARKYTLDSIQAYQEVGSTRGVGISMIGLAAIEMVEGRPARAIEIASAAEYFAEQEGIVNVYGDNDQGKIYLDNAKKELSELEIENLVKSGKLLSLKEVLDIAENQAILIT